MKISNLKRAVELKNKRDNMQCLLDADGFAYINDGQREYALPNNQD